MNTFDLTYYAINGFNSINNEGEKNVKILPYLSIVQVTEGNYEIALENGPLNVVAEGGFFIAPSGVKQTIIHHVNNSTKKMSARWLFIDVTVNKQYKLDCLYQFPVCANLQLTSQLNDLFNQLFTTKSELKTYACCYDILDVLCSNANPIQLKRNPGINKALMYLTTHYNTHITIGTLAKIANMSESNFYVSFKKSYGCSPIAYLNHYRLSLAINMLVSEDKTINEIAYEVGITDPFYFSKLFKKTFSVSPKDYKRIYSMHNN